MHEKFLRFVILISILISFSITSCSCNKSKDKNSRYSFSIDLDYIAPWTTQIVFKDIFKQVNYWNAYQLGIETYITDANTLNMTFNAQEYPTSTIPFDHDNNPATAGYVLNTFVMSNVGDTYPTGDYTLMFEGKGTISLGRDAGENPSAGYSAIPSSFISTGKQVTHAVSVTPNIGISIQIDASDANDLVRRYQYCTST